MITGAAILQNAGRIRTLQGAAAVVVNGVTPVAATGQLAIAVNIPDFFTQGLPFRTNGRMATADIAGGIGFRSQGMAFAASGSLVTDAVAPIAVYLGGLPLTAAGALAVSVG